MADRDAVERPAVPAGPTLPIGGAPGGLGGHRGERVDGGLVARDPGQAGVDERLGRPPAMPEPARGFGNSAAVFLLAVNVFLLLGGALMEGVTLLILVTPLLASTAAKLGIDPIHFGMVVVVNVVLGAITPPFGQLVFFVSSMTSIPSEALFREALRFLPLLFVVLGIVTYLPGTYLWTVGLFGP